MVSYKPGSLPQQITEAGESVQLALQALSDFHYEKLGLDLDKAESGDGGAASGRRQPRGHVGPSLQLQHQPGEQFRSPCRYRDAEPKISGGSAAPRGEEGCTLTKRELYRREAGSCAALLAAVVLSLASTACTPTVQVQAPKEPITINLNIKLDADVRLRIEEKAKEDVQTQPIF